VGKNRRRERVYVCVVVLEDYFRAETNSDPRKEFTYLEFWPISYQ